jgi:hypothetical protein
MFIFHTPLINPGIAAVSIGCSPYTGFFLTYLASLEGGRAGTGEMHTSRRET